MTTISDVWEAHRDELCEKIIELGKELIEELAMTLEEQQLIDQNMTGIVVELSEKDAGEMVVQSAGIKIASNPTALNHFLNIIKIFGIQPLAKTIEGKVKSLMISGTFKHMPKGKGTPAGLSALPPIIRASSHGTGSPTRYDKQSDHSNATSNTHSESAEGGRIPIVPSIQDAGKSSLTLGTGNMCYSPSEQAPKLNNSSQPLNQGSPNPVDKTSPQGIASNDSGIMVDLGNSSEVEATNFGSTQASPPVQRSHSATSDSSSDNGLLEGMSSPVRKKFQEMKVKNRELRNENWELKELERERRTVSTESTFVAQVDIELPDHTPLEVREYVHKLEQERKFLIQKTTETEVENDTLQVQLRNTQKWITTIISHYDRKIYDQQLEYSKSCVQYQELEREIEIATDPGMLSLRLRRDLEQQNEMLEEKVKEMEAEIYQLKNKAADDERRMQDLQQQKEEVVSMAVLKYFLPSALSEGAYTLILCNLCWYVSKFYYHSSAHKCIVHNN